MTNDPNEAEILTLKEVADFLKVTERTIYRLAVAHKIPAFKVGGSGVSPAPTSINGSSSRRRRDWI